ncbi:MAG TPA: bi-domain-containing oxidoreductase [Candidatus Bathyarchaeia archaeon]|nr:bi-domain-containing oxidoreductase [Candidatus Bathyarchaeia archaeon]
MKQLFQDPKAGTVQVVDLPPPALRPGTLLVRNAYSVVSPGTERNTVAAARDSYLKTARARPDLVRRVLDSVRRDGILAAYRKVQAKLSEPQALGYASAGVVVAVAEGSGDHFRVGDRVACCGQNVASHAEMICVPTNLAARVPDGVGLDEAAFATLGAIALHGVRLAEPQLGARYAVIGCGILGQLAAQLLRAHGGRVAAFDLDPSLVERARRHGAETGIAGNAEAQVASALAWTEGVGVDAVVVAAASTSDAPMTSAAGMCRDRGRVVALGFVPFGLPREIAYAKELELRISRSYGPGRYDAGFEEKGLDYPIGYVRWTETRNLESFLQAIADRRVEVAPLVTHRYGIDEAPKAYDELVQGDGARPLGIVIRYDDAPRTDARPSPAAAPRPRAVEGGVGIAFVGAGAFARGTLLPALKGRGGVRLERVVTAHGLTAFDAQRKFGFRAVGTDPAEVWSDEGVSLVVIATRHDTHAGLVASALSAGKHVFVEKPLALSEEQLAEVERAAAAASGVLLVGFNRRFAPMTKALRAALQGRGPLTMTYRVNAGALPPGHWLNDPAVGGGRIIGEGCHFVDLLSALTGDAAITSVQALAAGRPRGPAEDVVIQIGFEDGSAGQILYTAKGDPSFGKERLEAHAGGASGVIDEFRTGTLRRGGKPQSLGAAGKGHREELDALLAAVRGEAPPPIALATMVAVTRATFRVHASIAEGA